MKKKSNPAAVISALLIICTLLTACGSNANSNETKKSDTKSSETGTAESILDTIPVSSQIIEDAKISYLGPAGTYTEEAAKFFFESGDFSPKDTVDDAIADLTNHNADYAVIPQENTLGGAVTNYVDALIANEDVYVVGEVILPINQTLMGLPGASLDDITTVCSHSQGLTQTETWRKENLPDAATQEMDSTAAAANYVAQTNDKSIAAIAAPGAAELYGLEVLAENVQITDANKTRFYVLSLSSLIEDEPQKQAAFVANCKADMIDDIIVKVHETNTEIVTIHDRPEGSELGKYNYIIEVEDEDGISDELINELSSFSEVRYLGKFNLTEKTNK